LQYFREVAKFPWRGLIGKTAEAMLKISHPRAHGGTQLDYDDTPEPVTNSLELVWNWIRRFTPAESRCTYLHAFDQWAQFLAVLSGIVCGRGDAEHHLGDLEWHKNTAGVYVLSEPLPSELGDGLPGPWGEGPAYMGETLERASDLLEGRLPEIAEMWTWPTQDEYLRGLYDWLMPAAKILEAQNETELTPGATAVRGAVKDLYKVAVGRLGAGFLEKAEAPLFRPTWRLSVVAKSRSNLDRQLRPLSMRPVRIATDCVWFATNEADPLVFARSLGLKMAADTGRLGHFRHEGTAKLTPKLAKELNGLSGSPSKWNERWLEAKEVES
jgi:hypothetical protein